jgi:hypothetical protein
MSLVVLQPPRMTSMSSSGVSRSWITSAATSGTSSSCGSVVMRGVSRRSHSGDIGYPPYFRGSGRHRRDREYRLPGSAADREAGGRIPGQDDDRPPPVTAPKLQRRGPSPKCGRPGVNRDIRYSDALVTGPVLNSATTARPVTSVGPAHSLSRSNIETAERPGYAGRAGSTWPTSTASGVGPLLLGKAGLAPDVGQRTGRHLLAGIARHRHPAGLGGVTVLAATSLLGHQRYRAPLLRPRSASTGSRVPS